MLISISEALETPVSVLLGETLVKPEADSLKAISEKLEIINLQLARRKDTRRKILRGLLITLCLAITAAAAVLIALNRPLSGLGLQRSGDCCRGSGISSV